MRPLLLLVSFLGVTAFGCECDDERPKLACQGNDAGDTIFYGRAIKARFDPGSRYFSKAILYKFHVIEGYKGLEDDEEEVLVDPTARSSCGRDYEIGKEYLVYAARTNDGIVVTGGCSRTRRIEDPNQDTDLDYLRKRKRNALPSRGWLVVPGAGDPNMLLSVHPAADRQSIIARVHPSADGYFRVHNLDEGLYMLTARATSRGQATPILVRVTPGVCTTRPMIFGEIQKLERERIKILDPPIVHQPDLSVPPALQSILRPKLQGPRR